MKNYYYTSDLGLAVAISLFYPLVSINKTNPRKAQFVFEKSTELDYCVQKYWAGELIGNLSNYWNHLKVFKSRLYEGI